MNRPLAWAVLPFIGGLWVAWTGFLPPISAFLLMGAGSVVAVAGLRLRRADRISLMLLFAGLGGLLWHFHAMSPTGDALYTYSLAHPGTTFTIEGRIREHDLLLPGADYLRFVIDADDVSANGRALPIHGAVLVRWTNPEQPLFAGGRARVAGTLSHALGPVNFGLSDIEDYWRARDVFSEMQVRGSAVAVTETDTWSLAAWAARFRQRQAELLAHAMPPEVLSFVLAVWLGERSGVTESEYDAYVASGTAHILSVSGVHMAIVFLSSAFLLRIFVRRRRLRTLLTMGAVLEFLLISGARVSTTRSAVMIIVYLIADLFEREPDAPSALGISALLLLAADPRLLFDAGFLLSFLSVASILLYMPVTERLIARAPAVLRSNLAMSFAVQWLPLPLAIRYFNVFPLAAPLANLLVIPTLGIVLWLCMLTSLACWTLPPLALLLGHALLIPVALIRGIAWAVAAIPGAALTITSPAPVAIALFWAAALVPFLPARLGGRRVRIAAMAALLVGSWALWGPWRLPAGVDTLDVGQSDASVVCTPGGVTFLIDGGDRTEYTDMGKRVVVPYLYANHIRRLDYVVLTHADRDHIGGLFHVIEAVPVGCLLLGPEPAGHQLEQDLLDLCARRGVPVRRVAQGDRIDLGETQVEVLYPPRGESVGANINERSVVLRFEWPGFRGLFAGDIEAAGEARVAGLDCRADVLKVPHHGSDTSSTPAFIRAVAPKHAFVSARSRGKRDVLDLHVLQRYADFGAHVWRTDVHGGLRVRMAGNGFTVQGAREARGYALEATGKTHGQTTN